MSKSPSNPSPFSAELQTFIVTKYDPLLGVVKTLNERLHATNRDRFRLEQRLENLENEIRDVKNYLANPQGNLPSTTEIDEELKRSDVRDLLKGDAQLVAPWLFSCKLKTPSSSIQVLLDFLPDQTAELDLRDWSRESDMWIDLLENLPDSVPITRPATLGLGDLRTSGRKALMEMVRNEVLLILRSVPGVNSAKDMAASLVLVAIICAAVGEAWKRVEKTAPGSLGRVAIVLEGDDVGTKLHAGAQKLVIEPLN